MRTTVDDQTLETDNPSLKLGVCLFICFMVVDLLILLDLFYCFDCGFCGILSFLILFSCCFCLGLLLLFDTAVYCTLRISQEANLQEKQANDSCYP